MYSNKFPDETVMKILYLNWKFYNTSQETKKAINQRTVF